MEKLENQHEPLPTFTKASGFLLHCNEKVLDYNKFARICLRQRDDLGYRNALVAKALYVTQIYDRAEQAAKNGLSIPIEIYDQLDNLADYAWDTMENAVANLDYSKLERMLSPKTTETQNGNVLQRMAYELQQFGM